MSDRRPLLGKDITSGSATGCPTGMVSEGDPVHLRQDPSALLPAGLVETDCSWQGTGTKEEGRSCKSCSGRSHPSPASSQRAVLPPPASLRDGLHCQAPPKAAPPCLKGS